MNEATTIERRMRELGEELGRLEPDAVDLDVVERRVQELANAWGRVQMARAMKRADTDAPEVDIDGRRWGNRRLHLGEYHTVFGHFTLERSVYQQSGRGRVAIPMDLRLGIVEGMYTPRMARVATRAIALMPEEEAAHFLAEVGTATLSNSTLGRLPRAIAARYELNRPVIAAAVRARDVIPDEAVTVQAGIDGVMVPQDREHTQPRGRKTKTPEPPRHEQRYGPTGSEGPRSGDGTLGRSWHEAAVGTLAFFDADGERLRTIYLARMPEPHKATLVGELELELTSVLQERPALNVVFASDGAEPQWRALDAIESRLPANRTGHTMKLVDAFHVAEYVKKAANAIEGVDTGDAKVLAAKWRETIKEKEGGAESVIRSMRAQLPSIRGKSARADLQSAVTYIDRQRALGRMAYLEAQKRKYPIGTGVTEAAGKTIVTVRMKRAGARFSQHGGQTVSSFELRFSRTASRHFTRNSMRPTQNAYGLLREHARDGYAPNASSVKESSPDKRHFPWWPSQYEEAKAASNATRARVRAAILVLAERSQRLAFDTTGVQDHGMYTRPAAERERSARSRTTAVPPRSRASEQGVMPKFKATLQAEVRCSRSSEEVG